MPAERGAWGLPRNNHQRSQEGQVPSRQGLRRAVANPQRLPPWQRDVATRYFPVPGLPKWRLHVAGAIDPFFAAGIRIATEPQESYPTGATGLTPKTLYKRSCTGAPVPGGEAQI